MSKKTVIQYDEVEISSLVSYFVSGYQKDKGEITSHEYFIDTAKGRAVIKLYVALPEEPL
jgi:hypothetical protein